MPWHNKNSDKMLQQSATTRQHKCPLYMYLYKLWWVTSENVQKVIKCQLIKAKLKSYSTYLIMLVSIYIKNNENNPVVNLIINKTKIPQGHGSTYFSKISIIYFPLKVD